MDKKHEIINYFFRLIPVFGSLFWNCLDTTNKYIWKFDPEKMINKSVRVWEKLGNCVPGIKWSPNFCTKHET